MQIILFSLLAGVCGTGIGGVLTVLIGNYSPKKTCFLLSFAGGVMTSIVCFGLVPEATGLSSVTISIIGLVIGIGVIMLLNRLVDGITEKNVGNLKMQETHEALYHESEIIYNSKSMLRSGIIMLVAIALHNLPEGIAIGAGVSYDEQLGAMLAIIIALHNIPEGMAISAPLLAGGLSKRKIVLLTALSGVPTLIGAIIGVLVGNVSDTAIALALAGAGGAMLYVVFGEIIPQSVVMTKNRIATLITLLGIIVGIVLTA